MQAMRAKWFTAIITKTLHKTAGFIELASQNIDPKQTSKHSLAPQFYLNLGSYFPVVADDFN